MSLPEAVENLYRAFASYPLRRDMPACSCCTPKDRYAVLVSTPLRELDDEQISHFAFSAITTWGDLEDYKHFLPRILELAAASGRAYDIGLELWIIAGKLKDNGWTGWPAPERAAITAYFMALWEDILARYRPGWDGYDDREFLRQVSAAFDDFSPFLKKWAADRSLPALLMLADYAVNDLGDLLRGKGEWRQVRQREALVAWFTDPARGEALEAGIEKFIDDPEAETLATGLDFWRTMTGQGRE